MTKFVTTTNPVRPTHPFRKNISTTTPLHVDIINAWYPSVTKKLILRTSKRDISVENPVCSHVHIRWSIFAIKIQYRFFQYSFYLI